MEDKVSAGESISNTPPDMGELARELDSMPVEDLKEELGILLSEMDEDSFDGELLEAYLDAIDRKSPPAEHMDADAAYELLLKRLKDGERKKTKRRPKGGALKIGLIAAVLAALLIGSMVAAQAAGFDLFGRIARWTAETFGFASDGPDSKAGGELPPQLREMKVALDGYSAGNVYLPRYWPEGFEQSELFDSDGPEAIRVTGSFEKDDSCIILSYIFPLSDKPEETYNKDDDSLRLYEHNGIEFHIMTNAEEYLAVWSLRDVECCISGVESYEELIKILDSIGG